MNRASSLWSRSIRVLGGTLGAEWERDRRDALFLMGAIALTVAVHLGELPIWASASVIGLYLWRLGLILSGRPLPGKPLKLVAIAACLAGVLAEYDTVFGREAGVVLLVLFLGVKLLEMHARRDLFVVIHLCFFVLLTGFLQSQSPQVAALALIALVALMAAMLTMHFAHREASVGARMKQALLMVAQALPLAAILFVLFPRLDGPLWGKPDARQSGRTGISESMQPGQISKLVNDPSVAFRVDFEGAVPRPSEMYWRGPVLGHFDGRVWHPVRRELGAAPLPQPAQPPAGRRIRYRTTLEPQSGAWMLALETPVAIRRDDEGVTVMTPEYSLRSAETIGQRIRYEAVSAIDALTGLNETLLSRQEWLQLPPGEARRTLAMAAAWRREDDDPLRLVARALRVFREEPFRYTLEPPELDTDPVDRFLFETRAGFCEHYASAFVVLMRALDLPARVVTGYQGAEPHPEEAYWIVRQSNAHAWAEVWIEGRGWIRVDPTSAVAPERIENGPSTVRQNEADGGTEASALTQLVRRWQLSLDGWTHGWNQWVLNYDRGRQQSLLSKVGLDASQPRVLAGTLGALLALALGALAILTLRSHSPRDPIERAWHQFCARMSNAGMPKAPHETASHYLHRIDRLLDPEGAEQAHIIVDDYNRLRYEPNSATPERVNLLRQRVKAFRP